MHTVESPPTHLGLHHVALVVDDLDAACHFWVTLLGFRIEWQPDADHIYLTSGADNLALHRAVATQPTTGARLQAGSLDHLGIVVARAVDVHAWQALLEDAGVPIVAPTKQHRDGATSCSVSGPAGVVVQILHHPPISPQLSRLASFDPVPGPPA